MSKTTSGSRAPRPIPGLIHVTPSGAKERCRIQKRPCPYGGPHGRSLTRKRKNADGSYTEPPPLLNEYENLPVMTIGAGKNKKALEEAAEARNVSIAGGNDEETVTRLFPPREPKHPVNPNNGKPYPPSYDVTMAEKWDSLPVDEKLVEIDRLCHDRYAELGFGDLPIYYTNDFQRAGTCHYETVDGEIQASHFSMSIPLSMTGNYDSLFDTINHEAAHASNPGHEHDSTWSKACVENGGDGKTYHSIEMRDEFYKVRGTCSGCGTQVYRKGFPRDTMFHAVCYGTYSYEKNPDYVGNLDMNKALKKVGKEPNALSESELKKKKTKVLDLKERWETYNRLFDVKGYMRMCRVDEADQDFFMYNVRTRWYSEVKPTHTPRYMKQRFKAAIEAEGRNRRWGR